MEGLEVPRQVRRFFFVVALLIPVQKGKGRKRTEEDKAGKNRALTGNPFTPKTLTRRFLFIFNSEPCGRRYKAGEETRKGSVWGGVGHLAKCRACSA